MLVGLQASSQVIMQNVASEFNGKVNVCADSTEHIDFKCQIIESIDSLTVCPEYDTFIKMCNSITGNVTTSFVCQLTVKQTFDPTNPQRIIIRYGNGEQQIISYDALSITQKVIYTNFINKVKSQINK
jgi:hypothetical protein